MSSIKKRPNGTYQATIYVGRDSNGKQLFEYITRRGWKECKLAAAEIERELEEGSFVHVENIRVIAWIEKWLDLKTLSPSTRATYKSYLKNHYKPFFGQLKLKQVNDIHIMKFMSEKSKQVSQSSVRRMVSTLKCIFDDGLKQKSPTKNIKLPQEEKYIPRVLSDMEMEQIHEAVKGTKDEPIILIAAWCGLRRGEIFALKWDDVDWNKGILRVDESYSINEHNRYENKRPKSENGLREVIIDEYLLNLLSEMNKKRIEIISDKNKKSNTNNDDKDHRIFKMRPDNYSSRFAKLIRINNLPKIRFHDLRHYHASWLYDNDVPDQYAADRLGHDIRTLKEIYQHLRKDRQKELDGKMRSRKTDILKDNIVLSCPTKCLTNN